MTFTASFIIAIIIIARLFLKKTPRFLSGILWLMAGFRLICPFSIESALSLIPIKSQPIPHDITSQAVPHIDTGIPSIDNAVSSILPVASQSDNSLNILQTALTIGVAVWLAGVAAMMIYGAVSMVLLKYKINDAVLLEDNIYKAYIKTPFVAGFFRPKIYIPEGMPDSEKEYIILHERTHIKRYHNVIKLIAYFILSLHWFNPLAWAAFMLMSTDMEMSCDESVLKETGGKIKKAYSMSILSLATERQTINTYPIAFGEGNTRRRIINVLNYKEHSKTKIIISLILVTALAVGFMFNTAGAAVSQGNDDFQLAADFLANNKLIRVISPSDITTGESSITRKDMAHIVARLRNPIDETGMRRNELVFYGTKMDANASSERVYDEVTKTFADKPAEGMVTDFDNKVYDDSIRYCIENGIMDADWFSDLNAEVTLKDAVKMLVSALKYDKIADDEYINKASTRSVRLLGSNAVFPFKGVSENKVLTKNDAIMLAYNFMMSQYAVDIEDTAFVYGYMSDKIIDENFERYHYTQNYNINMSEQLRIPGVPDNPYNPDLTREEYIEQELGRRLLVLTEQPVTYNLVIQTFGAYVAKPISSTVTVNGKEISFDAYNINGSNYFRLLDIAYALSGTQKEIGVNVGDITAFGVNSRGVKKDVTGIILPDAIAAAEGYSIKYDYGEVMHFNPTTDYMGYKMAEKGTKAVTAVKAAIGSGATLLNLCSYKEGNDKAHIYESNYSHLNLDISEFDHTLELQEIFGAEIYEINGVIYFKLRDLANAFNFSVDYDGSKDTVIIDTSKPYPNRRPLLLGDDSNIKFIKP